MSELIDQAKTRDRGMAGSVWAGLTVVLAAAAAAEPILAGPVIALLLGVAAWRWPTRVVGVGAFAVMAIRPALDRFSERRLGLGPLATSPAVVLGLAILLVCVVLAVRRSRDRQQVWPDRRLLVAHLFLFLAYGIAVLSGVLHYGSTASGTSLREALRMASVLGGFLLVSWWVGEVPGRYREGWTYIVLGAVAPVLGALWQFVTVSGNLESEGLNRLSGTFSHPHTLGPYLVPFILVAVAAMAATGTAGRFIWLALAAALSVLLALTFSRTAELVLITGLIVLPLVQARHLGFRAGRALGVVFLFFVVGWLIAGDYVRERFSGLRIGVEAIDAARTGQTETSLEWRLVNWGGLIALGSDYPITGHGLGMTTVLNPLTEYATGLPYTAHDDFVRVFFEAGLLGLVSYLLYGALLCRWALLRARQVVIPHAPSAFAVAAALLALFFLTAGTPEWGTQTAVQFEVYGMLALMTAVEVRPSAVEQVARDAPASATEQ